MMIPNHSSKNDWNKYNALGVTQYGQMTAGSFMYIGPQGIVHGTTITLLNAGRMLGLGSNPGLLHGIRGAGRLGCSLACAGWLERRFFHRPANAGRLGCRLGFAGYGFHFLSPRNTGGPGKLINQLSWFFGARW